MIYQSNFLQKVLTISDKPSCLNISFELSSFPEIYTFDHEGRIWTTYRDGKTYRRGLDGKTMCRWGTEDRTLMRYWLDEDENSRLIESCSQAARSVLDGIRDGVIQFSNPLPDRVLDTLSKAAGYASRVQQDLENYRKAYQPVGILPPDQYMALILQATEGCSFNRCTFCGFYKNQKFHQKTLNEFRAHIQNVIEFLGRGISLRRTIFLGDANALAAPSRIIQPIIEEIHHYFDVARLGEIYSFLDGFSGEKRSLTEYSAYQKLGLKRVYIGLESGSDPLLQYLKKPATSLEVLRTTSLLKSAGISVGIIVLLGAGGNEFWHDHVRQTIRILNQMDLDQDDILYFSDLVPLSSSNGFAGVIGKNAPPLSTTLLRKQQSEIEEGLKFSAGSTPHISPYDIRDFVY